MSFDEKCIRRKAICVSRDKHTFSIRPPYNKRYVLHCHHSVSRRRYRCYCSQNGTVLRFGECLIVSTTRGRAIDNDCDARSLHSTGSFGCGKSKRQEEIWMYMYMCMLRVPRAHKVLTISLGPSVGCCWTMHGNLIELGIESRWMWTVESVDEELFINRMEVVVTRMNVFENQTYGSARWLVHCSIQSRHKPTDHFYHYKLRLIKSHALSLSLSSQLYPSGRCCRCHLYSNQMPTISLFQFV